MSSAVRDAPRARCVCASARPPRSSAGAPASKSPTERSAVRGMNLVRIGRLGRPHGLGGELALDQTDLTARELLRVRLFVWKGRRGESRDLKLAGARDSMPRPLIRFAGVSGREQAAELTNGELWAERERIPDPGPGVAYTFQLIGCRVVTEEGRELGLLENVWSTGANPVYVVKGERELLLPAHSGVVKRVNLTDAVITVSLPDGIEEL